MIDPTALRHHRLLSGLSQRALAKRIGVNAMTIQRLEAGAEHSDLSITHLVRMCDTLGVDANALLPLTSATTPVQDNELHALPTESLDHNEVKLLRRIHRGEQVHQQMNTAERTLTLPALIRSGVVTTSNGIELSDPVSSSLEAALDPSR